MKIAVLADIHGNVFALEAVLKDAHGRGATRFFNLGDIFYGPIAPAATYELLREQKIITISGNQDRQILEAVKNGVSENPTMEFVLNDLGFDPVDWLTSLPFNCRLDDTFYLCHGSPTNDLEYLTEDISSGLPRVRDDHAIIELLAGQDAPLILCGHTHIPRAVQLRTGQLVVNPGSVGLPAYTDNAPVPHSMQTFSPNASYALLQRSRWGWTVQHVRVPYDFQQAVHLARANEREDWAHFLSSGRGLPA